MVVSLDVFDTAITRTLADPDDVYLLSDRVSVESVEMWACRPRTDMKALHDQAVLAGERVVFVSDTDYPAGLLERLLANAGYARPKVYASSEHGVWKHNGLYEVMLRAESVGPSDVTHYGDNYQADYLAPRRVGIRAVHTPRPTVKAPNYRDNGQTFIVSHMEALRSLHKPVDYYYDVGYNVLGPLLTGFACWLDCEARRAGVNELWFCSSEGQIMRTVYETVVRSPLPTGYLYVSRRSMALPALVGSTCPEDEESIRTLITVNAGKYHSVGAGERVRAQEYLSGTGLFREGHAGIVDIGYNGTMQLAMRHYGPPRPWFYMATYPGIRLCDSLGLEHHDYACTRGVPARTCHAFQDATALLEPLLSATHGTVTGYNAGGPVFHEYAYEDFQRAAIARAGAGCRAYARDNRDIPVAAAVPPGYACMPLARLVLHPSKIDERNRDFRCYGSLDDDSRYENYKGPTSPAKRLVDRLLRDLRLGAAKNLKKKLEKEEQK